MMNNDFMNKSQAILDVDATQLSRKINDKSLTCVETVNTYKKHIKKVNPHINAIVETRFEQAEQEARDMDRKADPSTRRGKLYGIPISVKEAFDVKGMATTSGLISRKDERRDTDAEVVTKLKAEGAIIL